MLDRRRFMGPVDTGPPVGVNLIDYDSADWVIGEYISGSNESEITTSPATNNVITPILPYDSHYDYEVYGYSTASNRKLALVVDMGESYNHISAFLAVTQSEVLTTIENFNTTIKSYDGMIQSEFPGSKIIGLQFSMLKSAYTGHTAYYGRYIPVSD